MNSRIATRQRPVVATHGVTAGVIGSHLSVFQRLSFAESMSSVLTSICAARQPEYASTRQQAPAAMRRFGPTHRTAPKTMADAMSIIASNWSAGRTLK
jgi:hypothetical protein